MRTKLPVLASEAEPRASSVPPAPVSGIRLTGSYELDEDDVLDEDVMFHPSCEAVSCQNCGAYADRTCALLYFVARRTGT